MKILQIFQPDDLITAKKDMDALIAYQMPKRVPNGAMCFGGDFSVKNAGLDIAEVFQNPVSIYNAICWTASQYQWNPFLQYCDLSVLGCFDFGGTMIYPTKNGFILAPGCSSPVFTPPANMYAMTKAVEEYGVY